jgi:hypothetical protein
VTLIEVLIMMFILAIMVSLVVGAAMAKIQKAPLARCFAEIRSIQAVIQADSMEGGLPDPGVFWNAHWRGVKPGPYHYRVDGGDTGGGQAGKHVRYVLFCQHDHGDLARYVYVEDDGPPTVADAADDPHYDRGLQPASRL